MKIISFYKNETKLIKKAVSGNREAQRFIYDTYAPKMLGVCRQYIKDMQFAEDVMVAGFLKVFSKLDSFKHQGNFEGWIRKIMIRESISYLRKKQFVVYDDEIIEKNTIVDYGNDTVLEVEYIQNIIDDLPQGYKMVFVLFAIEGYKHKEIAEMLEISESTSKSQLFKARLLLQKKLREQNIIGYGAK
ncbi:RNA polymerase sigma factor [uncultured Maribacter sp.]|uniref:RNA polymerase sigma factor n=1 Tax=uncultured Maribacter sp. TaxID=431308 RepID=UPI002619E4FC|nr:RNA polymerase sigma factor [uncultured Maribacter sp.]